MKRDEIRIRDPFIFTHESEKMYYLFGTTDTTCWDGDGVGFDCYKSRDLINWEGPIPAFRSSEGFWATRNFWAPEVHSYKDRYYMFATFKADNMYRGTQILVSDYVSGPYKPLTDRPITPPDWECLDGTLHIDSDGHPWLVFCHEWTQVHNGAMYAMKLTEDLKKGAGRPVFLFNASEGPWVLPLKPHEQEYLSRLFPNYVTDGPYLHRMKKGTLAMLWSSYGTSGYAMGIALSENGDVSGPWIQEEVPLWKEDGGHGMIFHTFDRRLMLTFHSPNNSPDERAVFFEIFEEGDSLRLK